MSTHIISRLKHYTLAVIAALSIACVPVAAFAQVWTPPKCPNGQIYVSIAINGKHCVAIGNSPNSNIIVTTFGVIIQFLAAGVGLAVVGGIIYGGFLYITARGNAGQTEKGRDVIANALVGLLLFIFMAAILNFLLGRNIFR